GLIIGTMTFSVLFSARGALPGVADVMIASLAGGAVFWSCVRLAVFPDLLYRPLRGTRCLASPTLFFLFFLLIALVPILYGANSPSVLKYIAIISTVFALSFITFFYLRSLSSFFSALQISVITGTVIGIFTTSVQALFITTG